MLYAAALAGHACFFLCVSIHRDEKHRGSSARMRTSACIAVDLYRSRRSSACVRCSLPASICICGEYTEPNRAERLSGTKTRPTTTRDGGARVRQQRVESTKNARARTQRLTSFGRGEHMLDGIQRYPLLGARPDDRNKRLRVACQNTQTQSDRQ